MKNFKEQYAQNAAKIARNRKIIAQFHTTMAELDAKYPIRSDVNCHTQTPRNERKHNTGITLNVKP